MMSVNDPMSWTERHGFTGSAERTQTGLSLLSTAGVLRDQAALLEACHQGDLGQVAGVVTRHLREVLAFLDGLYRDEGSAFRHRDSNFPDGGAHRDDAGRTEQVRDVKCTACVLGGCVTDLAGRADRVALPVDGDEELLHVSSSVGGVEQDAVTPSSGSGAGEPTEEAPSPTGCHLYALTGSCRRCQAGGAS
ncbi:hypothetical protein [Actinomyces faecalis]|uniref:hypothetical protein n=1 Tax=Actinomyces faecalis TaxID=2722820 RepID=UPI00155242F5|nr:hypothetical protein [Actinomyces faecalis]